jgi:hypothetical protein
MPNELSLADFSFLVTDLHSILTPGTVSDNKAAIETIRDNSVHDAEALSAIFNDRSITDDGSVEGSLRAILAATESRVVPGLQTGIKFEDNGFLGDRNPGGSGFKDPHPSSNNQVGHFLTAVGLSFNPATLEQTFVGRSLRDWLGAPDTSVMDSEEVAIRLIVGHELAPDPTVLGIAAGAAAGADLVGPLSAPTNVVVGIIGGAIAGAAIVILNGFRAQFQQATPADVTTFRDALTKLGTDLLTIDTNAAEPPLKPIRDKIDFTQEGCSIQDLRLSLAGWRFGQDILTGRFSDRDQMHDWIRNNLEEP